jgi:hypothetical protein
MYSTTPIAVSKSDKNVVWLALLPFGFILLVSVLSVRAKWQARYFQFENFYPLVICLFFLCFGLMMFWNYFSKIYLFDDGIEKINPLGKQTRIHWQEVERIDFTPIHGKKSDVPRCRIYASGRKIELSSDTVENYEELESLIRRFAQKWSIQTQKGKAVSMDRNAWIALGIFVGTFAGLSILIHFVKPVDNQEDLCIIQVVLNAPPEALTSGKQRKTYAYVFPENQYPEFNFQIEDQLYYALKERKQLQAGDTLELSIPTAALNKKLLRKEEPTFWEKHIDWPKINVYHFKQLNP